MGRFVEIKLCPFRTKTTATNMQYLSTSEVEFLECHEEKCMMYDIEHKRCGLTHPIPDKKEK